ncbi:MAG: hypothetical protein GYA87_07445 [Christensenellaceae bacterium]|nr:hypothetical protein [Christensenellaceae bacterium]
MTTALLLIYSPIIVFCFYFHKKDYQSLYIISTISIIVMIFCSLVSAYLFNYDKNIPIKLAQNSYEYGILAVGEVYGLVNALSVLSSVLFVLFLSKKFKYSYERLFVLFLLLIFFVAIYTSRSSLTVLITFFSYVLALLCTSWFTNKGKAFGKKIIGLLVISFVLIVLIFAKEYIGETIMFISKSKSSKLLSRIYSIGESMVGIVSKNSQTGFLSRFDLIFTSIKTFLTNPFVGIYHVSGGNYFKLLDLGVGDHSQWFDMLASYGLLGVFPLFYLIITNLRVYYKNSKICHCWTFIIFLLGLVNPYICFTTIHIQFLIIPTLFFYKKILSFKDFNSYFI